MAGVDDPNACMCEDKIHDEPRNPETGELHGCDNPRTTTRIYDGTPIPLCQPCVDRGCMRGPDK